MPIEQFDIDINTEGERKLIALLTPAARREILIKAAQEKQRRASRKLMREYLDRIRSGEIQPETCDEEGIVYPTTGKKFYYRNEKELMTDIGRVPGHNGMHVLQKQDGTLLFCGGYNLREEKEEEWEDFLSE